MGCRTDFRLAGPLPTACQGLGKVHRIFNRLGTDRFNPNAYAQNRKILLELRNFRIRHLGDNPQRIRSEAAFAKLCGVCPVPASSGKTNRHRLNRGGKRRANAALYRVALVLMRHHPPTREYIQRRTAEGKSPRDIRRCLKQYIAREIYEHLCIEKRTPTAAKDS